MPTMHHLSELPSVEELVNSSREALAAFPRGTVVHQARYVLSDARVAMRQGREVAVLGPELCHRMHKLASHSICPVINATGVVLHTNLGRAPLGEVAPTPGYSNLEYDLETGKRGRRDDHVTDLLQALLGTAAITVNNNAAAVFLVLHELAQDYEAIISRGELVEIGDGFRIVDIMRRAGVILREVGTTNCTHIEDYRNAINDRTALLVRVHPSNFTIRGFTRKPSLQELAGLAKAANVPLYEDLGSGCMVDLSPFGIKEPLVKHSLDAAVSLLSFSGDKLLAGPQAGIIAGETHLVQRLRKNPMYRAFRLDKVILEVLRTTLRNLLLERWESLPAINMIRQSKVAIRGRAESLVSQLSPLSTEIIDGESVIGGGSTPEQTIPTALIAIGSSDPVTIERELRRSAPPVIARIESNRILVDLRTVFINEESHLRDALLRAYGCAGKRNQQDGSEPGVDSLCSPIPH